MVRQCLTIAMSIVAGMPALLSLFRSGQVRVERYTPGRKRLWNDFIQTARNATFLFDRDYMDYHSDRFQDHSLMIYRGNKLLALLPANLSPSGTLVSHEGLTYGGLVLRRTAALTDVLGCFRDVLWYLHEHGIPALLYKRLPAFYNSLPDEDVLYALFLLGARLSRRDCALVLNQADRVPFRRGRKARIHRAGRLGVRVAEDNDFACFWKQLLIPRLWSRYRAKPTHTVEEITLLADRFPQNVRQFSAYCGDELVAGATIYETPTVAHAQYIAASEKGRKLAALDYLFSWLIEKRYASKDYFDFGACNEDQGRALNYGLLDWKEGFGARCYTHDFYEVYSEDYAKLDPVLHVRAELDATPATPDLPRVLEPA
jgi:hypothetical protein